MPMIGLDLPPKEYDNVFDDFDKDGGGSIAYGELRNHLNAIRIPRAELQPGISWWLLIVALITTLL